MINRWKAREAARAIGIMSDEEIGQKLATPRCRRMIQNRWVNGWSHADAAQLAELLKTSIRKLQA